MTSKPSRFWDKLAHAFSLRPDTDLEPEDYDMLDRIARKVVERRMSGPVLLALQSVKPLGYLGSQVMIALKPFAELVIPVEKYDRFTQIMERREGLELLMERIEKAEAERL